MNASLHSPHPSAFFRSPLAWLQQAMAMAFAPHAATGKPTYEFHVLDAGDTIDVLQPLQHELVCLKGRLWITHDHAPADVVIERGQCYRPGSGSRMLVHAVADARLMVRPLTV